MATAAIHRALPGPSGDRWATAALNSGPGATSYGLDRLRIKGNITQTSTKPQRYAAV